MKIELLIVLSSPIIIAGLMWAETMIKKIRSTFLRNISISYFNIIRIGYYLFLGYTVIELILPYILYIKDMGL